MKAFTEAALPDPYAAYAELRSTDPVHWSADFNAWVLTRFADNRQALHDPALSSRFLVSQATSEPPPGEFASAYAFVDRSLVFSDPPDHTRLRRLVGKAFVPGAVEPLQQLIASRASQLLEADGPDLDLVDDLAEPLPLMVLGDFLGIDMDRETGRRVKVACDDFIIPWGRNPNTLTPDEWSRSQSAGEVLSEFVDGVIGRRPSTGDTDVVARLLEGEADDRLTRTELFANIVLLLIAGHENLTSLLGCGALVIMEDPQARSIVTGGDVPWTLVVDELLRLVSPNQFIQRRAIRDITIGGQLIREGDGVLLVLAAANRDPDHFVDPNAFILGRENRRDLSLGQGIHYCIGAPLGRLEATVALQTLFERYPRVDVARRPLAYVDNHNVRLLQELPVSTGDIRITT